MNKLLLGILFTFSMNVMAASIDNTERHSQRTNDVENIKSNDLTEIINSSIEENAKAFFITKDYISHIDETYEDSPFKYFSSFYWADKISVQLSRVTFSNSLLIEIDDKPLHKIFYIPIIATIILISYSIINLICSFFSYMFVGVLNASITNKNYRSTSNSTSYNNRPYDHSIYSSYDDSSSSFSSGGGSSSSCSSGGGSSSCGGGSFD